MDQQDRMTLNKLLRDLCSAQDNVTHYNEAGQTERCQESQAKRDAIKRRIVAFVEFRVPASEA